MRSLQDKIGLIVRNLLPLFKHKFEILCVTDEVIVGTNGILVNFD